MPRVRTRTTNRGIPQVVMDAASHEVIENGKSIRSVAKTFDICHVSLYRFIKKLRSRPTSQKQLPRPTTGYKPHNKVFTHEQEQTLNSYIRNCADLYFGLTPREVRKLAYECAVKHELKMPSSWTETGLAGVDWFTSYLKRNNDLTIRKPEATSLARAMNFNKANVKSFMDKYDSVLQKYKFEAQHVYNIDETGITTVQAPNKIVAAKGKKQIGAITSAERGNLVTMCFSVNAVGNSVPPMFIFPRVNYHEHFVRGGPTGCIGTANKSGWMQGSDFFLFMKHFANHVRPTTERKVLVLLDNHESHLSLPVIDFCRDNGIVLLSFPPHCSHKLQPLDRSVYGPLKKYVSRAMDSWLNSHPGKRITIYDIPEVVSSALPEAASPRNIVSGFRVSGIWPYNRSVFQDSDFSPSSVTDQALPEDRSISTVLERENETTYSSVDQPQATTPERESPTPQPGTSGLGAAKFSPENVRPYPKAEQRQTNSSGGRKRGKSAILTDTPEKKELEEKAKRRNVPVLRRRGVDKGKSENDINSKRNKLEGGNAKHNLNRHQNDEEDCLCLVCMEKYSNSRPQEEWIQCTSCHLWAHVACTANDTPFYMCEDCSN